jgi:hypothetical protein
MKCGHFPLESLHSGAVQLKDLHTNFNCEVQQLANLWLKQIDGPELTGLVWVYCSLPSYFTLANADFFVIFTKKKMETPLKFSAGIIQPISCRDSPLDGINTSSWLLLKQGLW